jgi:hypothetical protein
MRAQNFCVKNYIIAYLVQLEHIEDSSQWFKHLLYSPHHLCGDTGKEDERGIELIK